MRKYLAGFMGMLGCLVLAAVMVPLFVETLHATSLLSTGDSGMMFFPIAGMIVNRENISAIFTNLKTTFNKAFGATTIIWPQIAMKVTSTGSQNDYKWFSKFPKMRRWVGEKYVKSLEAFKYVIVNEDFEATVEVDRNDINDDNLGIYAPMAQAAGESSAELPDELVFEAVNGVFTNNCFDGQYVCDTDHPVVNPATGLPESVSNKGVTVLSAASQAAAIASLGAAATAMGSIKDDEGRPLNVTPNVLLIGVALQDVANALYTADRLDDGKVNLYKGKYKPVVSPRITSSTAWFLLDTTKAVKPFIFQEREAPVFVQQTDAQSDDVFNKKKFKFGAEARAASGYGFWQMIYGSTGLGA